MVLLPIGTRQPLTNGLPPCCGGSDENSQSPHIYLALCGSPGYHFSALSFVGTAVLLANDINGSMMSRLWAVTIFSKRTWCGKLQIHQMIHIQRVPLEQTVFPPFVTLKRTEVEISFFAYLLGVCVCVCLSVSSYVPCLLITHRAL